MMLGTSTTASSAEKGMMLRKYSVNARSSNSPSGNGLKLSAAAPSALGGKESVGVTSYIAWRRASVWVVLLGGLQCLLEEARGDERTRTVRQRRARGGHRHTRPTRRK